MAAACYRWLAILRAWRLRSEFERLVESNWVSNTLTKQLAVGFSYHSKSALNIQFSCGCSLGNLLRWSQTRAILKTNLGKLEVNSAQNDMSACIHDIYSIILQNSWVFLGIPNHRARTANGYSFPDKKENQFEQNNKGANTVQWYNGEHEILQWFTQ
jgi:hypothetical protein